jgi:hypothetical protein
MNGSLTLKNKSQKVSNKYQKPDIKMEGSGVVKPFEKV